MSHGHPIRCTAIIPLVFGVIRGSMVSAVIF